MYSQNEIDEAIAAGAISADAANALRAHVESQRALPTQDEEQFRLITGFNDIFVSIAAAILLFAVGFIGQWVGQRTGSAIEGDGPSYLGPLLVAGTSWMLLWPQRSSKLASTFLTPISWLSKMRTASVLRNSISSGEELDEENARASAY